MVFYLFVIVLLIRCWLFASLLVCGLIIWLIVGFLWVVNSCACCVLYCFDVIFVGWRG